MDVIYETYVGSTYTGHGQQSFESGGLGLSQLPATFHKLRISLRMLSLTTWQQVDVFV